LAAKEDPVNYGLYHNTWCVAKKNFGINAEFVMIVIYALLRYNERGSRPLQFLVDCLQEQLRTSGHALNFKASSFGPIDP